MIWETYRTGRSYERMRHKDCGREMDMPRSMYPYQAYWACPCGWFATLDYLTKKDSQWFADHFEGMPRVAEGGRIVWVEDDGGKWHTETIAEHRLNPDGTITGGKRWLPFVASV